MSRAAGACAPRVLLLAPPASYRVCAYLDAARAIGAELVVGSHGEHSLVPEIARGLHLDLSDPEAALAMILEEGRAAPFAAVAATDDATVELAARAARSLGLPHNGPDAARIARRKDLARARLASAGLPVPAFRVVDLDRALDSQLEGVGFPCVVKPLAMAASRGVIRADDAPALRVVCRRAGAIAAHAPVPEERRRLLVEDFVPGPEIALEGMLAEGRLEVLAVFDKPDPLEGPYFEESYYVTPSRHPERLIERAARRVGEACAAYGLRQGPVHAELRLHRGEAWMLEMAARTIGGDCARLLRFGTGHALEELVLANALGRRLPTAAQAGAAGVLMLATPAAGTLRRVEGVLEAGRVAGVEDVSIAVREGYEVTPLPEDGSYLGFVFARASTAADVERALREANALIRPVVAPAWRLEPAAP